MKSSICRFGESNHLALIVDSSRSVPGICAKVAEIGYGSIFPEHSVHGTQVSHGVLANSGDAHDLTLIVDRGRSTVRIAIQRGQCLDLPAIWSPDHSFELEYLR